MHFGRPNLMRRRYSDSCFRTVSSPRQNGFVPKKDAAGLEIHAGEALVANWAIQIPSTEPSLA
jgi:hypothetical protein